ncbi:tRNA (adenosine(37)-N6)-threonylcarbamoyltransferase complex ATPase subunit type 1 TsaE [Helicobacter sp. 12S02232-10]|uniref:tRNA (adenosine(37)-N6)-threonylcarbamoyltransferase complex ATPase subunit type 1 TsaE n=1 Tax=Helicobacter sp. 12S02232-10 TaxID=1476197 RepID=UPI000BA5F4C1|nr:tRNA (adenosine(37)-N6)-threonylcarbamoyltransferase complex ATPase subunit type 1 TsaE [Helicobacter sp. 12S02232-10]PAF47419.1 tRNA (adenosine(37)-N6)-threonylcarbamoyltransferase complex ATPase subunit type 1 TsaE [Helicobacter sp. 12S02232-10]
MKEICADLENIFIVTKYLKEIALNANKVFLLRGDLASGKTSLVRTYSESIYPNEMVTSPTFSVMHQYGDIYHYDLYNRTLKDLLALGLLEWLENEGTHFVEWGDETLEVLLRENGYDVCVIELYKRENDRIYRIFNE